MSADVLPFVVVVWDDAHATAATPVSVTDLGHRPLVMKSVGWLLRDDQVGVSVATETYMDDGMIYYRGHTFIPRGMIKTVTHMKLSTPRKSHAKVLLHSHPEPAAG